MSREQVIKLKDKYYVAADSTYADDRVKVLNHKDTFGIFDRWGDIKQIGEGTQGIYHEGTRFLSDLELRINEHRPLLLSSVIKEENEMYSIDLTNPEIDTANNKKIPRGEIHISRSKFIRHKVCYEKLTFTNFGREAFRIIITLQFEGDFKDIFEVRGIKRKLRGEKQGLFSEKDQLDVAYKGADGIVRKTRIKFNQQPHHISEDGVATFELHLLPGKTVSIEFHISFENENGNAGALKYQAARKKISPELEKNKKIFSNINTSNEQFNHWISRSEADLLSLLADTEHGKYPYAGVPWYNTVFGRDGILTAIETLLVAPGIARDVLKYLAATQAREIDPKNDAEPGKIMHERRGGEMANTGEIPFKMYYGTIDATPLFVVLAGKYYRRTADLQTIRDIWPNIKAALQWIDAYGDVDGDGFVEYKLKSENGLVNQGWKDSFDSISHANGALAEAPIALCEVQGYVYEAKLLAAELAETMDDETLALQLKKQARILREQFHEYFWDDKLQNLVLALDGYKKPCLVQSSNVGHCLFSGIVEPEYAARIRDALFKPEMFTGWGIRTLSAAASRYNPMSYHNGSIWPHDNALIAYGLARYGFHHEAEELVKGLFDASLFIDLQRLPELFCGFERRKGEGPTAYPVACSPQAWSVGAVYLLVEAMLRIHIDAVNKKIDFYQPSLPPFIESINLNKISLGETEADISFHAHKNDVGINVISKPENWQLVVYK